MFSLQEGSFDANTWKTIRQSRNSGLLLNERDELYRKMYNGLIAGEDYADYRVIDELGKILK
jgi:hypothetical protein